MVQLALKLVVQVHAFAAASCMPLLQLAACWLADARGEHHVELNKRQVHGTRCGDATRVRVATNAGTFLKFGERSASSSHSETQMHFSS